MRALIYITIALLIPALALAFAFSNGVAASDSQNARNQLSPSDTIKENEIKVYPEDNEIIIPLPEDAVLTTYTDTKSMDPVFDKGANGIEIPVTSETILQAGAEVGRQSAANWMKGRKKAEAFLKTKSDKVFIYELSENEAQALINKVKGPVREFYLKRGGQDEKKIMAIIDKFYGR